MTREPITEPTDARLATLGEADTVRQRLFEEILVLEKAIMSAPPRLAKELTLLLEKRKALNGAVVETIQGVRIEVSSEASEYLSEKLEP